MVDYNRDGISDLVHRGMGGFAVFTGYYNSSNVLSFKRFYSYCSGQPYTSLYYLSPTTGCTNAYNFPGDIPAITDIDGDGDIDFMGFDLGGSVVYFNRNCQVEDGLPNDSIRVCVQSNCWGKMAQTGSRVWTLGYSCDEWAKTCPKKTHAGNCIEIFDFDGDGDKDLIGGNVSFSDVQLLINSKKQTGYPVDTMTTQDTTWGVGAGKMANMPMFPAPFFIDGDQDGANDLIITPHATGYENYKCAAFYKNIGTTANPNFSYRSDTFLVEKMIDLGTGSYPAFYDYNKDGKPDMFVGSDGYYQAGSGTMRSRISYFQNTSGTSVSSLTEQTRDFLNLASMNLEGTAPAFGDLNNDGKDDIIVGLADGTIMYFTNTAATNSTQPVWVPGTALKLQYANNTKTIDVGSNAAPFIYDLDKDGRPDLIVGSWAGFLYYFKNTSTVPGQMKLDSMTNKIGGVKVEYNSAPFIGKTDSTGNEYLLVGSSYGLMYRYDGFQGGNFTTPYTMVDSAYQGILLDRVHPAIADIDGDSKFEMVLGNTLGGLKLYKQVGTNINDIWTDQRAVKIYPNPAQDILNLSWDGSFTNEILRISIVSVTGQLMQSAVVDGAQQFGQVDIERLQPGAYYCIVQTDSYRKASPVIIVR